MNEEYISSYPRKRQVWKENRNIKAMLPYPITLTWLRKQTYRKMASCIRLLNIGMKMKISLCQFNKSQS